MADAIAMIGVAVGILAAIFGLVVAAWAVGLFKSGFQRSEPPVGIEPIAKSALSETLLRLNRPEHPFRVMPGEDTDLAVEWDIVDAKWIEILGRGWACKAYRAWLLLDEATKTVKYCEKITESGFQAGGGLHVGGQYSSFTGIQLWGKQRGYRWGIRDDFTVGEIYNYRFSPSDVKDVIRQIANDHGWAFELVTTRGQATRQKSGCQSVRGLAAMSVVALGLALGSTGLQAGEIRELHQKLTGGQPAAETKSRTWEQIESDEHGITEIGLERTACFGTCPVYTVIFKADGTFRFVGEEHVQHRGRHRGRIEEPKFRELAQFIVDSGYMQLESSYSTSVTDLPTVYTTVVHRGARKVVSNYASAGPTKLWAIEQLIDKLLLEARWE